jgi:anti-sigma B factor antagonist
MKNLIESKLNKFKDKPMKHGLEEAWRFRRASYMNIAVDVVEEICIIRPQTDIDSFNVSFLKEKLKEQVDSGHYHIIMDLEKVRFMDSAALGILVSGMKTCMEYSGELGIINPSRNVENLFKITHLDSIFKVYSSQAEALAAFRKAVHSN